MFCVCDSGGLQWNYSAPYRYRFNHIHYGICFFFFSCLGPVIKVSIFTTSLSQSLERVDRLLDHRHTSPCLIVKTTCWDCYSWDYYRTTRTSVPVLFQQMTNDSSRIHPLLHRDRLHKSQQMLKHWSLWWHGLLSFTVSRLLTCSISSTGRICFSGSDCRGAASISSRLSGSRWTIETMVHGVNVEEDHYRVNAHFIHRPIGWEFEWNIHDFIEVVYFASWAKVKSLNIHTLDLFLNLFPF